MTWKSEFRAIDNSMKNIRLKTDVLLKSFEEVNGINSLKMVQSLRECVAEIKKCS